MRKHVNGRRAWRKWVKAYRRWLNKEERRYRDPYDDEPLIKHQYTWFEAKKQFGLGPIRLKTNRLTAQSLVGMTQGARKRAARKDAMGIRTAVHDFRALLRIGQRLRPCLGCEECRGYDDGIGVIHCDGSGVLPSRRKNWQHQ